MWENDDSAAKDVVDGFEKAVNFVTDRFQKKRKKTRKQYQKKRIKRQYQAEYRKKGAVAMTSGSRKTKEAGDAAARIADAVSSGSKVIVLCLAAILLLFVLVGMGVAVATPVIGGIVGGAQGSGYQSSPEQLDAADLELTKLEMQLRQFLDSVETNYRGYDEYAYTLGPIGHNPFTLINYLSAKYGKIERAAINEVTDLFNASYMLSLTESTEKRTRTVTKYRTVTKTRMVTKTRLVIKTRLEIDPNTGGLVEVEYLEEEEYEEEEEYQEVEAYEEIEEYFVKVLRTQLSSTPLETIAASRLSGNPQAQGLYGTYAISYGLVRVFGTPLDLNWNANIGSYYGYRLNPSTGVGELHRGLDLLAPEGTSVKASFDGTVKEAAYDSTYGYYVSIKHEKGYVLKYAHLRSYNVRVGQTVAAGDVIGTVGGMDTALGSHLHLELMKGRTYYNPLFYLQNGY